MKTQYPGDWRPTRSVTVMLKSQQFIWGLPPLLITVNRSDQSTVARTEREESFMTKTTQLLYVGHFINEQGHLGMRRDLHVYMEYYLIEPHVGHRVGL